MNPPQTIYVVFAALPWEFKMAVATSDEERDRMVKYYDNVPKSGRVWYETYDLRAKCDGCGQYITGAHACPGRE